MEAVTTLKEDGAPPDDNYWPESTSKGVEKCKRAFALPFFAFLALCFPWFLFYSVDIEGLLAKADQTISGQSTITQQKD